MHVPSAYEQKLMHLPSPRVKVKQTARVSHHDLDFSPLPPPLPPLPIRKKAVSLFVRVLQVLIVSIVMLVGIAFVSALPITAEQRQEWAQRSMELEATVCAKMHTEKEIKQHLKYPATAQFIWRGIQVSEWSDGVIRVTTGGTVLAKNKLGLSAPSQFLFLYNYDANAKEVTLQLAYLDEDVIFDRAELLKWREEKSE